MTLRVLLSVALVAVCGLAAQAQTEITAGTVAAANGVPTVTIINKSTEVTAEAKAPELEILPAEPVVAAPAPADVTPADATAADTASTAAAASSATPPATAAPATAELPAEEIPAEPTLAISIDLSRQSMTVSEEGTPLYTWPISSAAYGYRTPVGTYKPTWMAKMWYSRQYDNAPMPHAIFFHKGVAIHATYALRSLGRPASHGCVRLAPKNAATLFRLVNRHGKDRTEIVVHGQPNHGSDRVAGSNRMRRSQQRYLPPRGYSAYSPPPGYYYAPPRQRRGAYAQQQRRYQPRGLYNSYSSGYGF